SLGADSPLEYLPGKRAALSGDCYPEISLGDLPLIYPYIFSATGEGLIAKRRGRGVLIDHLTPPVARVTEAGDHWAEMETLHAQYCAARDVKDGGRLAHISERLRELMILANLLEPEAAKNKFKLCIEQLPRRIEQLRKRFTEKRAHRLGQNPEPEAVALYLNEARGHENREIDETAIRAALARTSDEMDRLVSALSSRFIPPGPSGHLSRGKTEVLPTGRNFYGTDLRAIPTQAAWQTGVEMGRMILLKYLEEEGSFPGSIAVTLWSSDVFRSDGELISQGLWLAGCRPVWASGGRVLGIEVIPAAELTMRNGSGGTIARPRVDIIVQMSGIVRDTLPNLYMMLDDAVEKAAALDEPENVNYIRAHVQQRLKELQADMPDTNLSALHRLARCRVFSSKAGSYGTGVGLAIDAAAWENDTDLAESYINWTGFAYGKGLDGGSAIAGDAVASLKEYSRLMGTIDIAYQKAIGPEYDAMSIGCYSSFQGGMAVVNRAVGEGKARMYWGDSSSGAKPEIRTLSQEIDESLFAKLLNPDWIEQKKLDGGIGAHDVSCMINTLFHWSATSRVITDEQFDSVWRTYIENAENRRWLQTDNIYALEEITRRLLEAASRALWNADEDKLETLRQTMLTIEGDIEDSMGNVKGEFQGSSVDIKKRKDVEKWQYAYTLGGGAGGVE
ncbi:MAG: cobaltochelatase subunit CobN, partial [Acidobacteriota bacterium]|nr:cobaltochelatase subunit CobN [Acidobacteriota bacterium]